MNDPSNPVPLPGAAVLATRAGQKLRQIRERLNMTLRAVEESSMEVADAGGSSEFVVSTGRLNQIENDGSLPSIYKLYSLAVIYGLGIEEILGMYGIHLSKMEDHRQRSRQARTHRLSAEIGDPQRPIRFPVRFDPGFRPQETTFLSRVIQEWGEIPVGLLASLDLKRYLYGYIGLEDRTMFPLLRPGSVVQIDESRRRVVNQGWTTEFDRPIYFLELRYSYECCWCYQRGRELTLVPHPMSCLGPRTIRIPDEGEVLGQVVGVAMRLAQ